MKILFLDIDGVLNKFDKHIDRSVPHYEWNPETMTAFGLSLEVFPEFIDRLNKITDTTGAKIVVTSSWRIGYLADWSDVVIHLHNCGLRGFIVGRAPWMTDDGTDMLRTRGDEVKAWLKQHENEKIESIVILDDNKLGNELDKVEFFIQTDHKYGLQDEHVARAIEILNRS